MLSAKKIFEAQHHCEEKENTILTQVNVLIKNELYGIWTLSILDIGTGS